MKYQFKNKYVLEAENINLGPIYFKWITSNSF